MTIEEEDKSVPLGSWVRVRWVKGNLTHDPPVEPKPLSENWWAGWADREADGALA